MQFLVEMCCIGLHLVWIAAAFVGGWFYDRWQAIQRKKPYLADFQSKDPESGEGSND